jgi:hypothetical protein
MDALNPLVVGLLGVNINRLTVDNVHSAGLHIERVDDLSGTHIFKLIVAM